MSLISNRLFEELGPEKETALEFFAIFSRFEQALKYAGFCENTNDGAKAKADWGKYAEDLPQEVKEKIRVEADHYLLHNPPKIQTMKQGAISWQSAECNGRDTTMWIFDIINIVRNNLFHGGKYKNVRLEDIPDHTRETSLVRYCLNILYICLKVKNIVTEKFFRGLGLGRYGNSAEI